MQGLGFVFDVFARCWDITGSLLEKWETGEYSEKWANEANKVLNEVKGAGNEDRTNSPDEPGSNKEFLSNSPFEKSMLSGTGLVTSARSKWSPASERTSRATLSDDGASKTPGFPTEDGIDIVTFTREAMWPFDDGISQATSSDDGWQDPSPVSEGGIDMITITRTIWPSTLEKRPQATPLGDEASQPSRSRLQIPSFAYKRSLSSARVTSAQT
jgi:hypothetical protein